MRGQPVDFERLTEAERRELVRQYRRCDGTTGCHCKQFCDDYDADHPPRAAFARALWLAAVLGLAWAALAWAVWVSP